MSKPEPEEGSRKEHTNYASATWSRPRRLSVKRFVWRETARQWWRWLTRRKVGRG
jgi:hypothetical protein